MASNQYSPQQKQQPLICHGHTRPVPDIQFSRIVDNEFFLVSSCKDGKPMLRYGETGDWIGTFEGHKGAVWTTRFNDDASKVLTGSADFTAKLFDAFTGSVLQTYQHNHIVRAVAFHPTSPDKVVTAGNEKLVRLWDISHSDPSAATVLGKPIDDAGSIKGLMYVKDNLLLSIREKEALIRIYDERVGNEVASLKTFGKVDGAEADAPITSLSLSWDGRVIVGTAGKYILIWNAADFSPISQIPATFTVSSAHIHPSLPLLVSSSADDTWVHMFDLTLEKEVEVMKGHHGPVHAVQFSPDGEVFVSGSEDGTVRLWQTIPGTIYGLWQPRQSSLPPALTGIQGAGNLDGNEGVEVKG